MMKMSNLWFECISVEDHWSNALKGLSGGRFSVRAASVGSVSLWWTHGLGCNIANKKKTPENMKAHRRRVAC